MIAALVRAEMRARRRSTFALGAGSFVFQLVLAATYSAFGANGGLEKAFGQNSKVFAAFAGSAGADVFSPSGFLAFGFGHPMFLILSLAIAVAAGTASVADDVDTRRADLIYTAPIPRAAVLGARMIALVVLQLAVLLGAAAGAYLGMSISAAMSSASPAVIPRVLVAYLPLVLLIAAVATLASVLAPSRGAALAVTVGVVAGCYLVNLASFLWPPLAFVRRVEPFGYYEPARAAHAIAWTHVLVLSLAAALVGALAVRCLARRDLS